MTVPSDDHGKIDV